MDKKVKKSVIVFSIISALSGWIGVLVNSILTKQPKGESLGMLIWLVLPLLTAVFIRIFKNGRVKALGLKPNFKGNLKWYLTSFLIFPAITIIVLSIGSVTNCVDLSKFHLADFAVAFLGMFVFNFIKNIFEELAWRGFLTERLINLKCIDLVMYMIVVIVWSLWHVPYYLFLLSVNPSDGSRVQLLFSGILVLVCWIIMFTELYRITRSIWPCVILHAVNNSLMVIYNYISIKGSTTVFLDYNAGIISIVICILIGIFMRKYRIYLSNNASWR